MIYCNRMLYTSALFVTALGGLPSMVPGSLEMLGLDWHRLVESWKGDREQEEYNEKNAPIFHNSKEKTLLAEQVLAGKISLLQTAQRFRELDQKIQTFAQLRSD